MTLSDVVVRILLERQEFENRAIASDVLFQTFRKEFPYWAFSDWNIEVSPALAKMLVQHFTNSRATITDLILDLPPLVGQFQVAKG